MFATMLLYSETSVDVGGSLSESDFQNAQNISFLKQTTRDESICNNLTNSHVCVTKDCIAQSHKLFQYMNKTVDPCDDFYQYSCGNYIQETIIPDDLGFVTASFSPLRYISKFLKSPRNRCCH